MEADRPKPTEENLTNDENLEIKSRKRRFSATEVTCNAEDDNNVHENLEVQKYLDGLDGNERSDIVNGAPATKYRDVQSNSSSFTLDELCDELLFEIFKHLDTLNLISLMNCCYRFRMLALDTRFWKHIDLISQPLPLGILEEVLERTQVDTHTIKLRGPPISQHVISEIVKFSRLMKGIFDTRCPNLRVMELEGIIINFKYVRVTDFPKKLTRLIIKDCDVRIPEGMKSIFGGLETHLTYLEELGIEDNDWFEPYYIMLFSKAPNLRWLSLKGCKLLSEFVPYGSIAARFGFKKLEYLDLRFTPITDPDLQCFNAITTLKEILLDCPPSKSADFPEPVRKLNKINVCDAGDARPSTSGLSYNQYGHSDPIAQSTSSTSTPSTSTSSASTSSVSTSLGLLSSTSTSSTSTPSSSPLLASVQENTASVKSSLEQMSDQRKQNISVQANSSSSLSESPSSSISFSSASTSSIPSFLRSLSTTPTLSENAGQVINVNGEQLPSVSVAQQPEAIDEDAQQSPPIAGPSRSIQVNIQQPGRLPEINIMPSIGRFVQRPDQVVLLTVNERRRLLAHRISNQIDEVIHHPLFWNMFNPLGHGERPINEEDAPDGENGGAGAGRSGRFRLRCELYNRPLCHRTLRCYVSDRGICCFGRPQNPVDHNVIWIRVGNRPELNSFHRLSVRNYKLVTDISLRHLVQCSPSLEYLDVSGTSVTLQGIQSFKQEKPSCTVIAEHLVEATESNDDGYCDDEE